MGEFSNPESYELWMGRWSARLAPAFVGFANPPPGGNLLDVGSGTGVLSRQLLDNDDEATVVGIEPAESYVSYSRARLQNPRVRFERGDAMSIPFENDAFDASLSLLIIQELSNAPQAVKEMRRVTRPGGVIAASQWDFGQGMPMLNLFWQAAQEVVATDDARQAAANGQASDYPNGDALVELWKSAGLANVSAEIHEIQMSFASFEDYWAPFLTGITPTSSYARSLSETKIHALKDCLRGKILDKAGDGSFTLVARAWSVRGHS